MGVASIGKVKIYNNDVEIVTVGNDRLKFPHTTDPSRNYVEVDEALANWLVTLKGSPYSKTPLPIAKKHEQDNTHWKLSQVVQPITQQPSEAMDDFGDKPRAVMYHKVQSHDDLLAAIDARQAREQLEADKARLGVQPPSKTPAPHQSEKMLPVPQPELPTTETKQTVPLITPTEPGLPWNLTDAAVPDALEHILLANTIQECQALLGEELKGRKRPDVLKAIKDRGLLVGNLTMGKK